MEIGEGSSKVIYSVPKLVELAHTHRGKDFAEFWDILRNGKVERQSLGSIIKSVLGKLR